MVNSKGNNQEATMESTARLRKWVLVGLAVGALVSSLLGTLPIGDYGKGLALNLGTELAGALMTYILLELVIGRRERREAKKADLIAQMGSNVKDVAIAAAEELARRGWLYDGSLQGAHLANANLQGAHLIGANLQVVFLAAANLQGAFLMEADLQWAILVWANLQGANLVNANLQGADFDEDTTLPDGTKWTPGTDMTRFTDPRRSDFWRPDA
jgi:hypothetical protein